MTIWSQRRHLRARAAFDEHRALEDCRGLDRAIVINLGWERFDVTAFLAAEGWQARPAPAIDPPTSKLGDDPTSALIPAARSVADHIRPGQMTDFLLAGPRSGDLAIRQMFADHLGHERVFAYPDRDTQPAAQADSGQGRPDDPAPSETVLEKALSSRGKPLSVGPPAGSFGIHTQPYAPRFKDPGGHRRRRRWRR
ncbi:MAG: hypothetical protein GY929_15235 [Actinomycetia bacterium]|nr:hypothetical protein [Actinomycetes bacterium]